MKNINKVFINRFTNKSCKQRYFRYYDEFHVEGFYHYNLDKIKYSKIFVNSFKDNIGIVHYIRIVPFSKNIIKGFVYKHKIDYRYDKY